MMMTDEDLIYQLAEDLRKYAKYEGTEVGETCTKLIQLATYRDYLSEEFLRALQLEMREQLDNFETYATIVETEETFTRKIISVEWE